MMNSERDWESSLLIVKVKQLSGKSPNARLVIWLHHRLFAAYQYLKFIRKRNWSQLASFIIHISRNLKAARENLAELDEIQRIFDILNEGSTFKVTPASIDIFHNHKVQTIVHQGHFHNFQQHILQI